MPDDEDCRLKFKVEALIESWPEAWYPPRWSGDRRARIEVKGLWTCRDGHCGRHVVANAARYFHALTPPTPPEEQEVQHAALTQTVRAVCRATAALETAALPYRRGQDLVRIKAETSTVLFKLAKVAKDALPAGADDQAAPTASLVLPAAGPARHPAGPARQGPALGDDGPVNFLKTAFKGNVEHLRLLQGPDFVKNGSFLGSMACAWKVEGELVVFTVKTTDSKTAFSKKVSKRIVPKLGLYRPATTQISEEDFNLFRAGVEGAEFQSFKVPKFQSSKVPVPLKPWLKLSYRASSLS